MNWNDTSVRFWAILLPLLIWNIHITKPVRLNIAQRYLIWLKWAFIKWSTSKYQQFHHQFTVMWILYRVHSFTSGFSWDFSMEFTSEWRFTLTDILWYQNKLGHIIHLRNSKYYSALARELRRLLISRIAFLSCRKGFTVFYPLSCWQNKTTTRQNKCRNGVRQLLPKKARMVVSRPQLTALTHQPRFSSPAETPTLNPQPAQPRAREHKAHALAHRGPRWLALRSAEPITSNQLPPCSFERRRSTATQMGQTSCTGTAKSVFALLLCDY